MSEAAPPAPASIWDPRLVWVTIGAIALIFLAAVQALAVTTVMPVVSAELDGAALYAVAFSGTLATSVIGMVATGAWADRTGPVGPLYTSVALFVAGLIVAGIAPTMEWLVVGRLVQGLGAGGQTVALYVVVARIYPPALHGRVFAAFAAAWVVPSLVGPFAAGAVTQYLHWRWVFIGVAVLAAAAFVMVAVRLHGIDLRGDGRAAAAQPPRLGVMARLGLSAIVAVGVLVLGLSGDMPVAPVAIAAASIVVVILATRPLLPRGTLLARRGLPSVVLSRGLIAGAFFSAEIYVPYLLIAEYGFSPTWAGLGLTTCALAWATGSWLQGRIGDSLGNARIGVIGCTLVVVAIAAAATTAAAGLSPVVLIVGWTLSGAGMGLLYPRLTVLTLAYSTPQDQGANSSALSIADSVGASVSIAVLGLVFTAATDASFAAVFGVAAVIAVVALVPSLRLGHGHEEPEPAAATPVS